MKIFLKLSAGIWPFRHMLDYVNNFMQIFEPAHFVNWNQIIILLHATTFYFNMCHAILTELLPV